MFYISGHTFANRAQLKAIGCKWNPAQRCWETENRDTAMKASKIYGIDVIGKEGTVGQPMHREDPDTYGFDREME